jgi:hypothetical protein
VDTHPWIPYWNILRAWFNTRSVPIFNEFLSLFYPKGVKTVPPNIGDILTARALAFWAIDDGAKKGPGFILCTV